jgi:Na+-driven multidrug efflux pump
LPKYIQTIIDVLILTCFLGFIVLGFLSFYWFKRKSSKYYTPKLWKYANQFLWIFIVQCVFVTIDWILCYRYIYKYDNPDD